VGPAALGNGGTIFLVDTNRPSPSRYYRVLSN